MTGKTAGQCVICKRYANCGYTMNDDGSGKCEGWFPVCDSCVARAVGDLLQHAKQVRRDNAAFDRIWRKAGIKWRPSDGQY